MLVLRRFSSTLRNSDLWLSLASLLLAASCDSNATEPDNNLPDQQPVATRTVDVSFASTTPPALRSRVTAVVSLTDHAEPGSPLDVPSVAEPLVLATNTAGDPIFYAFAGVGAVELGTEATSLALVRLALGPRDTVSIARLEQTINSAVSFSQLNDAVATQIGAGTAPLSDSVTASLVLQVAGETVHFLSREANRSMGRQGSAIFAAVPAALPEEQVLVNAEPLFGSAWYDAVPGGVNVFNEMRIPWHARTLDSDGKEIGSERVAGAPWNFWKGFIPYGRTAEITGIPGAPDRFQLVVEQTFETRTEIATMILTNVYGAILEAGGVFDAVDVASCTGKWVQTAVKSPEFALLLANQSTSALENYIRKLIPAHNDPAAFYELIRTNFGACGIPLPDLVEEGLKHWSTALGKSLLWLYGAVRYAEPIGSNAELWIQAYDHWDDRFERTVCKAAGVISECVARIELEQLPSVVNLRSIYQLKIRVIGEKGTDLTSKTVITWLISDPTVATVDAANSLRGLKEGSVTITARAGGKSASVTADIRSTCIDAYLGSHTLIGSYSQPVSPTWITLGGSGTLRMNPDFTYTLSINMNGESLTSSGRYDENPACPKILTDSSGGLILSANFMGTGVRDDIAISFPGQRYGWLFNSNPVPQ